MSVNGTDEPSWLWKVMTGAGEGQALWSEGHAYSYRELLAAVESWQARLAASGVLPGARVAMIGEYTVNSIALFLALVQHEAIIVPLADDDETVIAERLALVGVDALVDFREGEGIRAMGEAGELPRHPLIESCASARTAGIIMFTSGSTGKSKAVLYRADFLIEKFRSRSRKPHRTLLFLKFDHIGGINTLLSVLSQAGTLVVSPSRQADNICRLIQDARVTLLPTTPSFLTMLFLSRAYETYDVDSLEVITYGTEVMPPSTLRALAEIFPCVHLKQTYGLTELGIMATRSKSNESEWIKLGGEGVEWRVVSGLLWIRTKTPMLGYLNAPCPFDEEGWYNTGDQVEVDGEYLKVLGRRSEIINVGGEKVHPQEVEGILMELENVAEVLVRGVSSPVTGQTVCAEVCLLEPEDPREFRRRMREFCQARLARYKVPTMVRLSEATFTGSRLKKRRVMENIS
jgi:acyl-CoA synthetase (AMP-forming)/AMP-acid ligase II